MKSERTSFQQYGYIAVIAIMGLLMVLQQCNGGRTVIVPGEGRIDTLIKEVVRWDTFERQKVVYRILREKDTIYQDGEVIVVHDTIIMEGPSGPVVFDSAYLTIDTVHWVTNDDTLAVLDYEIVSLGPVVSFAPYMEVKSPPAEIREIRQFVRPVFEIQPVIGATVFDNRTLFARGLSGSYRQFGATYLRHGSEASSYLVHYKISF